METLAPDDVTGVFHGAQTKAECAPGNREPSAMSSNTLPLMIVEWQTTDSLCDLYHPAWQQFTGRSFEEELRQQGLLVGGSPR